MGRLMKRQKGNPLPEGCSRNGNKKKQIKRAARPHNFMNNQDERNYISVGSWMGMMFVTAIPVIGLFMVLVWAFTGENESRKNYFRAILAWILIFVVVCVALGLVIGWLGGAPAIQKFIQDHQNLVHNQ